MRLVFVAPVLDLSGILGAVCGAVLDALGQSWELSVPSAPPQCSLSATSLLPCCYLAATSLLLRCYPTATPTHGLDLLGSLGAGWGQSWTVLERSWELVVPLRGHLSIILGALEAARGGHRGPWELLGWPGALLGTAWDFH